MKVLVNDVTTLTIDNPDIKVREGKLYNTKTQLFEGVQGDTVWFLVDRGGWYVSTRGIVDGYTDYQSRGSVGLSLFCYHFCVKSQNGQQCDVDVPICHCDVSNILAANIMPQIPYLRRSPASSCPGRRPSSAPC